MAVEQTQLIERDVERPELFGVDNLSYTYDTGRGPALEGISFVMRKGETIGIAGDSGSGKTTLLYALSGFIPHFYRTGHSEGSVTFNGQPVQETPMPDLMEDIAIVFQDPSTQNMGVGVEDALAFGMENRGVPPDDMERRIDELGEQFHIAHLRGRNTMDLSGGERQATAIASMMAMDPEVLMFDEAISALDTGGQDRIKRTLAELRGQGKSMLVVDSDTQWLAQNVDRMLVLKDGRLVYDGDPQRVVTDPDLASLAGLDLSRDSIELRESPETDAIIAVDGVRFAYGDGDPVLNNISLQVKRGSCTALVGHNGSGKTTLAKLIAGLDNPTSGTIMVGDADPAALPSRDLVSRVGYVFQNPSQTFCMQTVGEELRFAPSQIGREPAVSLDDFGLGEDSEASPWELSAGHQQRLAIAGVMAADPDIVIFDEPTLGQTRRDRDGLVNTIQQMQEQGKTVIVISHDLKFVADAATDVHVLERGNLIRSGAAVDVLNDDQFFHDIGLPLPWSNNN